ncbi:hypothetical protein BSKO_06936 [Bryopsis sp. KO-2023]|nr:hypothetical protein BSKO_06936 [Bryopsis sp. KO-2023]
MSQDVDLDCDDDSETSLSLSCQNDAYEVCDWVESLNLGQYRNKFAHNCIDGGLLLDLTDSHLKYELGIGPLGHRYALKKAIDHLRDQWPKRHGGRTNASRQRPQSAPMDRPRRPASASSKVIPPDSHLGPAHGKITVYEQRSKLMFEIDRAQARAAHKHTIAWNMLRNATFDEEEVKRLCGEIAHLESFHKIELSGQYGVLDMEAKIPWHPTGDKTDTKDPFPERIGKSRDHPRVEETFTPRLNKASMAMMNEGLNQGRPMPFMDRLRRDLQERKSKKQKKPAYMRGDEANPATNRRDFKLVAKFFASKFGTELPEDAKEAIEMVHDTVEQYPDQLGLYDAQVQRILKKQGMQKISAVASAVRTLQFMERFRNESKTRDDRNKNLMKKWYSQSPSGSGYKSKWQFDLEQCQLYFAQLGWTQGNSDDPISEDRLNSLLKRAKHYKDAKEKNKEGDIDWGVFSADGLSDLQSRRNEKEVRELEREAQRSAEAQKPSAVDQALGEKSSAAAPVAIDPSKMPQDWLMYTVHLVSGALADDICKLQSLKGVKKQVAVYRKIRTLKFLEFTAEDLMERNRKTDEMYAALAPERKVITKEQADNFFQRLMEDGIRRREKRERMISEKKNKEEELARQLAMKTSPTQRTRPSSARSKR